MSDCHSDQVYPVSLDDPARQYVSLSYLPSSTSHWIVGLHTMGMPRRSGLMRGDVVDVLILSLPLSKELWSRGCVAGFLCGYWTRYSMSCTLFLCFLFWFKASDKAQRCFQACYTATQLEVAKRLYRTNLPDHVIVDNTDNDWDFAHVLRAIQFCAAIRDRQKNLGEPVNPPSAWPILYNSFFDAARADSYRYSDVDIRRAFMLCFT